MPGEHVDAKQAISAEKPIKPIAIRGQPKPAGRSSSPRSRARDREQAEPERRLAFEKPHRRCG